MRIPRPAPATVIALVALAVALAGSATAARTLIQSQDLASNAVKTRNIAKGAVTKDKLAPGLSVRGPAGPAGPAGAAGATGPAGPAGATGAAGAAGARGVSAWDTIPSGQTVTGEMGLDVHSAASGDYRVTVSLPARSPVTAVNFASDSNAATTDDDPTCTGTSTAPTAPPGKVCLYRISNAADTAALEGFEGHLANQAFLVTWSDSALSSPDVFVRASWAYTAP